MIGCSSPVQRLFTGQCCFTLQLLWAFGLCVNLRNLVLTPTQEIFWAVIHTIAEEATWHYGPCLPSFLHSIPEHLLHSKCLCLMHKISFSSPLPIFRCVGFKCVFSEPVILIKILWTNLSSGGGVLSGMAAFSGQSVGWAALLSTPSLVGDNTDSWRWG